MRVLLELKRLRLAALDRAAHAVQGADARITRPREDQLRGAAGCDQLVVDEIGRETGERQITALLADDLVRGGEADEMREPFDDEDVAIAHEAAHRLVHAHDLAQAGTRSSESAASKMRRPVFTSSSSITSGGAMRIVLWPHPSSSRPRLNAASSSSCTMWW